MTSADALTRSARRQTAAVHDSTHRRDIDGLRALAILLVVVYHVWTSRVSGGVDVFLMISAYFLTATFVRRLECGGDTSILRYWLRRFARLLPLAGVAIVITLVAVWLFFLPSTWSGFWPQSWASLFYFQNWELAASAVDYYARGEVVASPLQHFWSLSVQGQVFVIWPILIVGTAAVARRFGGTLRSWLIASIGLVGTASFVYSVVSTASNQTFAYFDTFARVWEFALGSLLALVAPRIRLGRFAAAMLGIVGLLALVSCGMVIDARGGFPGYLALWPTLAAGAVIIAGQCAPASVTPRLLSSRWLVGMAGISYALYLVHWPLLITYLTITDSVTMDFVSGSVLIAASIVLATIVTYGVERPVHKLMRKGRAPVRQAAVIAVTVLAVGLPTAIWQSTAQLEQELDNPGAAVLLDPLIVANPEAPLEPQATLLDREWVDLDGECTGANRPTSPVLQRTCLQNAGSENAAARVLVVGDSHAQQWTGVLEPIAEDEDWDIVALLKGGCTFAADEPSLVGVEDCEQWREAAVDFVFSYAPDFVVLMGTKSQPDAPGEWMPAGLDATVGQLRAAGIPVVLLRDNPRFGENMYQCVEEHGPEAAECTRLRATVLAEENPSALLASDGVALVDLSDLLCPDDVCQAVIGGVCVYIDDNHLSRAYARTMAPGLSAQLQAFVPDSFHAG